MTANVLFAHQFIVSAALLLGDILATIAVAYGIVLETPKDPDARQRLAVRFVIAGVIFEALFTIGLFAFDQAVMSSQGTDIQTLSHVTGEAEKAAAKAKSDAGTALATAGTAKTSADSATINATAALRDARDVEGRIGPLENQERTLKIALNQDEERAASRVISKRQYDIIATLLGKIPAINFSWQSDCLECLSYADQIVKPFTRNQDKISIKEYTIPGVAMTGILIISKTPPDKDIAYLTLKRAGIEATWMDAINTFPFADFPRDVPLIFVGEKYHWFKKWPYLPPPKKK